MLLLGPCNHIRTKGCLDGTMKRLSRLQAKELINAGLLLEEDDVVPARISPEWSARACDCESVLSRHSNLDNRPWLLSEPRCTRRQSKASTQHSTVGAVPEEPPQGDSADASQEAPDGGGAIAGAAAEQLIHLPRRSGESRAEHRERKAGVKVQRRVARQTKKAQKCKAGLSAPGTSGGVRVYPIS